MSSSEKPQKQGLHWLFQIFCCRIYHPVVRIDDTVYQQKQDLQADGQLSQYDLSNKISICFVHTELHELKSPHVLLKISCSTITYWVIRILVGNIGYYHLILGNIVQQPSYRHACSQGFIQCCRKLPNITLNFKFFSMLLNVCYDTIFPTLLNNLNVGETTPTVRSTQRMGESGNFAHRAALLRPFMDLYWKSFG